MELNVGNFGFYEFDYFFGFFVLVKNFFKEFNGFVNFIYVFRVEYYDWCYFLSWLRYCRCIEVFIIKLGLREVIILMFGLLKFFIIFLFF